jgi:hypothetical protein
LTWSTTVCSKTLTQTSGTWVAISTKLNENASNFRDPLGCDYNYVFTTADVPGTSITWESVIITEQLYQIYTHQENTSTGVIQAWRTLNSSLIPTAYTTNP